MRQRLQRREILSGIETHHAVLAWRRHVGNAVPVPGVLALKERVRPHHKSAVYLLRGCGPQGTGVVAKHRWAQASDTAPIAPSDVYSILDRSPEPVAPRFYGAETSSEESWVFFEYLEGLPFDENSPAHRAGAARLAAHIHGLTPTDRERAQLPERTGSYYLDRLEFARSGLERCLREYTGTCPPVVASVLAKIRRVEDAWPALQEVLDGLPATVTHGDFAAKNLVARRDGTRTTVFATDWDTIGYGYRHVDLECVEPAEYFDALTRLTGGRRPDGHGAVPQLSHLLRTIDGVAWTVPKLQAPWSERPFRHLSSFDATLGTLPL